MKTIPVLAFKSCAVIVSIALLPSAAKAEDPLADFEWFVPGKWVAEAKTREGGPLTVETKFAWAANKKALKYSIQFTTKDQTTQQYDGTYFWHPASKEIRLLQIDAQGNVTESVVEASQKEKLTQTNRQTRADGTVQEQRVEITRQGDDAFRMKALLQRDGAWVEVFAIDYHRVEE
jgi:hypothetical protein